MAKRFFFRNKKTFNCSAGFITLTFVSALYAQNLVVNGSFSDSANAWEYLMVGGGAQATGTVVNGVYELRIPAAGVVDWNVQLRHKGINLIHGETYRFSFDAWAAADREIIASAGMDHGNYPFYCLPAASKFHLTTKRQRFVSYFSMDSATDTNARIQFNCGLSAVDVFLDSVMVEKVTTPLLVLISPNGGEEWCGGTVQQIGWVAAMVPKVSLAYSTDAGLHWNPIADTIPNAGVYQWSVPKTASPWCLVRVSSADNGALADTSSAPFELGMYFNLVNNGSFIDSIATHWDPLGVYGNARAHGSIKGGEYVLSIDTAGDQPWNVQFTQSGIALTEGESYVFSFDAWGDAPRPMQARVGQSGGAYLSFTDTTAGNLSLTASRQSFSISFVMPGPSESNARVEFNSGIAVGVVHLDNVALYRKRGAYPAALKPAAGPGQFRTVGLVLRSSGAAHRYRIAFRGPIRSAMIFDLQGRLLSCLRHDKANLEWDCRQQSGMRVNLGTCVLRITGDAETATARIAVPNR